MMTTWTSMLLLLLSRHPELSLKEYPLEMLNFDPSTLRYPAPVNPDCRPHLWIPEEALTMDIAPVS